MFTIEEVNLESEIQINEIKDFLLTYNLKFENDIDFTIAIYVNGNVIATASKTKNVLKCFAIHQDYQGQGITNSLIKKIEDRMFQEGRYHFFIYTKLCNKDKFLSIGYKEIITAKGISILENGNQQITRYLQTIKKKYQLSDKDKACIVMNANPFTKGHRYLVEQAANKHAEVLILVVTEDQSSFPFDVRFRLIQEGVSDLPNVTAVETGPYLISQATFPSYFLKDKMEKTSVQMTLDCMIFVNYYKEVLRITDRYIGEEPYCEVTRAYNEVMQDVLPQHGVDVHIISRLSHQDAIISASKVRELIRSDKLTLVQPYVPKSTYTFLQSEEAKPIIKAIQHNHTRH